MKICFIGSHLGLPKDKLDKLKKLLLKLITNNPTFYCGTYGEFDMQVVRLLYELKKDHSNIRMVKIKPYYQFNKHVNKESEKIYNKILKNLKYNYDKDIKGLNNEIKKLDKDFIFKNWFEMEQKYFNEVLICDLPNKPYRSRIIECNKWKVDVCDILISYCPIKYSNSDKIKTTQ